MIFKITSLFFLSVTCFASAVHSRNPLLQPFASSSIWNMPIGSGAVYVPAGLSGTPGNNNIWAQMPGMDQEHLFLNSKAPLTPIYYSKVGWNDGDRCPYTAPMKTLGTVPMESSYTIPDGNGNTATVHLMSDNRTILQFQPVARCTATSYATALVTFTSVDLYGDGISGGHGGSGLSSYGGSIRLGELRPSNGLEGPRHALKVNVFAAEALFSCTTRTQCYRWPALTCDSYAIGNYGNFNNNQNTAMKMGSLLAIPAATNISNLGLMTQPAKQLAWTLQNYGAYIVDDTSAAGFDFSLATGPEGSKAVEFKADYGFEFVNKVNYASTSVWVRDIQKLVQSLYVVNNNSPTTIGGGGTPRQPLAAPITPGVVDSSSSSTAGTSSSSPSSSATSTSSASTSHSSSSSSSSSAGSSTASPSSSSLTTVSSSSSSPSALSSSTSQVSSSSTSSLSSSSSSSTSNDVSSSSLPPSSSAIAGESSSSSSTGLSGDATDASSRLTLSIFSLIGSMLLATILMC